MSGEASTSDRTAPKLSYLQPSIRDIKEKLHKQSITLRKMKKVNSVDFITTPDNDFDKIIDFYLDPMKKTLYISQDATKIIELTNNFLTKSNASEQLSQLKIGMNKTKKLFEHILEQIKDYESITSKRAQLQAAWEKATPLTCDFMVTTSSDIAWLNIFVEKGKLQTSRLEEYYQEANNTGNYQLAQDYLQRKQYIAKTTEEVDQLRRKLEDIRLELHRATKPKSTHKLGEDSTAVQTIAAVQALRKQFRNFNLKIKTHDPIAKNMMFVFGEYQADVNLLLNYYLETAKLYKFGTSELKKICAKQKITLINVDGQLEDFNIALDKISQGSQVEYDARALAIALRNAIIQNNDFMMKYLRAEISESIQDSLADSMKFMDVV